MYILIMQHLYPQGAPLPYQDIILQLLSAKDGAGHSWTYTGSGIALLSPLKSPRRSSYDVEILSKIKKEFSSAHKLSDIPTNIQLIKAYRELVKSWKIKKDMKLEQLLKKRGIRSQSGIVSVQVLTKPWPCPGKCIFCPSEKWMPKSYIKSEPGAMRAALNKFDPIKQVYNRLRSLSITGHETDKIEMIVLGWTFDCYMKEYKIKFIKSLYDACNTFSKLKISDPDCHVVRRDKSSSLLLAMTGQQKYKFDISNLKTIKYSKTLAEAMKKNETAKHRIIWLTIETRPEFVTDQNCLFWRELGVTRIEMWVQSLDDAVLKANKRWNTVKEIRRAFDKMRRRGFKISVHIMPGLYMSNYKKDLKTFVDLYKDSFLKPDEIKFYPTSVIPGTKLAQLYKKGEYTPLETEDIKKLIRQVFLEVIPPYTRIKRLIRDIPANEIMAWSKITNLGQLVHQEMNREFRSEQLTTNSEQLRRKRFYERLWPNLKIILPPKSPAVLDCSPFDGDFKSLCPADFSLCQGRQKEKEIQTFIIGQRPNVKTFRNFVCLDTRSREIRQKPVPSTEYKVPSTQQIVNLVIRRYVSSVWMEYFISYEDQLWYLYGFCRLLLGNGKRRTDNDKSRTCTVCRVPFDRDEVAMIRELHVYGNVETIQSTKYKVQNKSIQHTWFWKRLMEVAEKLAKQGKYKKIAVISGVGVRWYYKKLWYKLNNTYMVKTLLKIVKSC